MWIVGLGNPGSRYAGTRHNVGLEVALGLRDRWKAKPHERGSGFESYAARIRERPATLILPLSYMNRSGSALEEFEARGDTRVTPAETLVLCDDVYLPIGTLRLRARGSTGGHRGLASIERFFGTSEYPRLRIGVGGADDADDLAEHVLSRFEAEEEERLEEALARALEATEVWLLEGITTAMNRFNRRSGEVHS